MTNSDDVWLDLARRLRTRRVELDPRYKNLSEFSRATGVNYKTLQRAEGGRQHTFGRGTLVELDLAYEFPPGTIEAILVGESTPAAGGAAPLSASPHDSGDPADEQWDGYLAGEPHLREGEVLRWRRVGDSRIRYVLTRHNPATRREEHVLQTLSAERGIGYVVQRFRDDLDAYSEAEMLPRANPPKDPRED